MNGTPKPSRRTLLIGSVLTGTAVGEINNAWLTWPIVIVAGSTFLWYQTVGRWRARKNR